MDTAPSLAAGDKTSTKSPSKEHILNERYLLQEELGRGAQGVVFRATDRVTGQAVAIKRMSLADMTPETLESYEHEITLLQNLKHKHIVQYQGHFKSRHHLHVVLEYMEKGSIAQVVKQILPDETIAAVYTSQVLEGLAYLHSQGVVHRDIKGANILTNAEGAVKLGDFGVAVRQPAGDLNGGSSAGDTLQSLADGADADVAGSPYWMAPEVIMMKSASAASDIWSVGCLVVEMITGAPPYYELQQMSALFRIVQDDYPPLPDGISPELEQFLLQCFEKDPHLRPTAKQLLRADWIRVGRRRVRDREWRKSWRNTVVRRPPPEEPDATPEPSTPPETLVAVAKPSGAEGEEGKRSAKRGWRARREARERERSSLVADEAGADVPTAKGPSVVAVHESVAAVLQRAVESENWDAAPDIEGGDSRRDGPGGLLPDGGKTSRMSFDHAGDTRYRGTRNFLPPFMRQPSVAGSSQAGSITNQGADGPRRVAEPSHIRRASARAARDIVSSGRGHSRHLSMMNDSPRPSASGPGRGRAEHYRTVRNPGMQHLLAGTTSIPENMQDEAPDRPLLGVGNERVEPSGSSLVVPATGAMRVDGEKQVAHTATEAATHPHPPPGPVPASSSLRDSRRAEAALRRAQRRGAAAAGHGAPAVAAEDSNISLGSSIAPVTPEESLGDVRGATAAGGGAGPSAAQETGAIARASMSTAATPLKPALVHSLTLDKQQGSPPEESSRPVEEITGLGADGEPRPARKVKKVQMSVEPPPSVSRTQSNARDHDNRFLSMPLETWISHANAQANGPPLPLSFGPSSAATAGSASNVHSPLSGFASGFPLSAFGSGAFDAAMAGGRSVTAQDAGNPPPSTRGTSGTPTPLSRMFHGRGAATLLNSKSAPKNVLHAPSPKAGQGEGNVHGGGGEVHAAGARAARGRVRRALANVQEAVRQDRAGGRMRRRASTAAKAVQKPQVAAAELLQALLEEDVDARQAVLDPEGLVVLLDLLDSAGVALSDELADVTMDIVNTLVSNDADVMSLMLLHGAAPQVLALASPGHRSLAVLSRVAVFLYAMCTLSPGSLRQLLCAGGVPVLVRMLGHGAVEDPAYAQRLLGCVWEVLERSEPIMLNSMCRIMARAGLVPRLFELVTGTTEALHDLNAARARGAGKAGGASEQFAPKVVATADGGRGLLGARGAVGGLASALASLGLTLTTALNPLSSRASGITSTPGGLGGGQKSTLSLSQSLGRSDVANGRANGDGARPKATDAERREALEATRAGAALVLTVCSHADSEVRHEFCSSAVLEPLLSCLGMMPMSIQAAMVRCYKHVSTEPSLLEDLQQGGLLEQLVNRLQATSEVSFSGPRVFENPSSDQAAALELRFEAISALHSLCKFDRHRQEIAATAGLIPSLCTFASSRIGAINPSYAAQLQHELRDGRVPESLERERAIGELAMALLCAMVYGTARTRLHLGAPALEVLLQAIHEDRWQLHVLDGLAAWLHDELHRVEPKLLEPPVIQCIVDMLDGVRREHAEARDGGGAVPAHAAASQRLGRILEPLIKILRASKRVAAALGRDGRVTWNVSALLGEERDALLRRSLLKVIRHLYEHHPQPKEFLLDPHLQDALHRLTNAEHENAVMVRAEAQKLLDAFRLNTVM